VATDDVVYVTPSTLAVDAGRVYFHDGEKIVALERKNGNELSASEALPDPRRRHHAGRPARPRLHLREG
jgi:hypothetical protein